MAQGIEASSSNGKGTVPLARLNGEKSALIDGKGGLQNEERTGAGVDNMDAVDAVAHATGKLSLRSDNAVNGVNGKQTETSVNGTKDDSVSESGSAGDSAADPTGTDGQLLTEQTSGFEYYGQFHPYGMVPPPPPPGPGMPHHFGPQPGHPVGPIPGPMPGHAGGTPFAYGPPGYMPPPPGVYGMDPRFGPVQGAVPGMGPMPGMMVPGGVPGGVPGMPGGPAGGGRGPKYYGSAPEYAPRQPRPRSSAPREPRYPRQQYDGGRPQSAGSGASSPHPQSPDQLLRTALREPKNRLFVLRLERTILSLLRTPNEHSVELERMNSFHRLLAHKLADYYGIGHTSSADQSVLYYKVDGAPPGQLPPCLADLEAAGSQSPGTTAGSPDSASSGPGLVPTSPEKAETSPTAQQVPSKKVVVAKRPQLLTKQSSDGHDSPPAGASPAPSERASSEPCRDATSTPPDASSASADSSTAAPRGRGDYEARVAAYEEARARIFQQSGDDEEDDDEDNEAPDGRSFGVPPPPSDDLAEYARDPRWHANLAGTVPSTTSNAPIRMNASDSDLYHRASTAPGSGSRSGASLRFSGQSFVPRRPPKTRGPPAP